MLHCKFYFGVYQCLLIAWFGCRRDGGRDAKQQPSRQSADQAGPIAQLGTAVRCDVMPSIDSATSALHPLPSSHELMVAACLAEPDTQAYRESLIWCACWAASAWCCLCLHQVSVSARGVDRASLTHCTIAGAMVLIVYLVMALTVDLMSRVRQPHRSLARASQSRPRPGRQDSKLPQGQPTDCTHYELSHNGNHKSCMNLASLC